MDSIRLSLALDPKRIKGSRRIIAALIVDGYAFYAEAAVIDSPTTTCDRVHLKLSKSSVPRSMVDIAALKDAIRRYYNYATIHEAGGVKHTPWALEFAHSGVSASWRATSRLPEWWQGDPRTHGGTVAL